MINNRRLVGIDHGHSRITGKRQDRIGEVLRTNRE
jgi:hypothetical protein